MRSCVVTGAASGIGRGIALRFVEAGWNVVGLDVDGENLGNVANELQEIGTFVSVEGNVAENKDLQRACTVAADIGTLTCWINNAGYNIVGNIHELQVEDYSRGIAVNLGGMFWGTSTAVRQFLSDGTRGNVINISSITALQGFERFAAYAMCKGGIIALSREVAAEYVDRGIRCNVIAPGVIDTPINAQLVTDPSIAEQEARKITARTPMGRPGTPRDVAEAALFLADDHTAGYITGATLVVDGGCTVIGPGR